MKYLQELNPFTKDYVSDFLYLKNPIKILKNNDYIKYGIKGNRLDLILSKTWDKPYYLGPNIDNTIRKALINKDKVITNKYTLIEIYRMNMTLTVIGEIEYFDNNYYQEINYDFDTEKKDYYIIEVDDEEEFINDKKYIQQLYNFYKKLSEENAGTSKSKKWEKLTENLNQEEEINLSVQYRLTYNDGIFSPEANLIFYEAELSEWGKPNYKRYKLKE
jgi:hypothetical protein